MRLRPHHLLCVQNFAGKGYSAEFTDNMSRITSHLRRGEDAVIDIVRSTDDICAKCTYMIGDDLCRDNEKVKAIDEKAAFYLDLEEKSYIYRELLQKIKERITEVAQDDICSGCSWHAAGDCKDIAIRIS